jgi:fucose permease
VFFAGETIARLTGAIVLNWIKSRPFLLLVTLVSLTGVLGLLVAPVYILALVAVFVIGLGAGNMFPVIFSLALEKMPDRANEISGLLIMAVSGGAFIPPVMGFVSTALSPLASIAVVGICMLYILWVSFYVRKN